ncbi:MAG: hypothetical protein R2857_13715 [Vampirovibrionales bacterium]
MARTSFNASPRVCALTGLPTTPLAWPSPKSCKPPCGSRKAIQNAQDGIASDERGRWCQPKYYEQPVTELRELTKQAANDTYDVNKRGPDPGRVGSFENEITRIANGTTFNGVNPLNSAVPTRFVLQIGANNDTRPVASTLSTLPRPWAI